MAIPTPARVVLLGLMGSGKSTVGRLLAARTGWPYLDNDELLRAATGKTLTELAAVSADHLHDAERAVLRDVLDRPAPLLAGAAAAVLDEPHVGELVHAKAVGVYLHVPPDLLADRIGDDENRPWLRPDPRATLERMYADRDPLYRKAAVLTADGSTTPEHTADWIYAQLPRPM